MALISPPPWVSFSPFDFVNAAGAGARLGLERAQMATGANDAAQRLQQGYAQLAATQGGENYRANLTQTGENNRAAAANALRLLDFQAGLAETARHHEDQATAAERLDNYRQGILGVRKQHEDNTAYGNKLRRYMHVGNNIVDLSGDSPVSVFSGPAQIDPYERMDYQNAIRRVQNARTALNRAGDDKEAAASWQKELDDASAELEKLKSKRSAADVLDQSNLAPSPEAPLGWQTTPGGYLRPVLPPDNGTVKVGKYFVTPLGAPTDVGAPGAYDTGDEEE